LASASSQKKRIRGAEIRHLPPAGRRSKIREKSFAVPASEWPNPCSVKKSNAATCSESGFGKNFPQVIHRFIHQRSLQLPDNP
jgi:hypothetical protein